MYPPLERDKIVLFVLMIWQNTKRYLFPGIFLLSLLIFLAHTAFTKTAIFADGRFYYAITRSLVKDFDLKFANEYEVLDVEPSSTHNDYVWNKYPPGAPLLWAPLFFIVDGALITFKTLGLSTEATGFGVIYEISVAATTAFLGTFGLYLVYQLLKNYFSNTVATLATLAFFGGTNLLFYIAVEPINSHAASFFVSSLFVYYFLRYQKEKRYYLVLGLIGGVAGLVRTQDLLILVVPVVRIIYKYKHNLSKLITNLKPLTAGFTLGFLPQIFFWKKIFNTFWYSPYFEEGISLLKPQISHVLFNFQNGLFTLTPIVAISFLGLFLFLRKSKILGFYAFSYFLIQLYVISSWSGFFQGGSFSIRMMVTTYPLLSFGLASVIDSSRKKIGISLTFSIIILMSALNSFLIIRYLLLN